jgi:hypothetical protein
MVENNPASAKIALCGRANGRPDLFAERMRSDDLAPLLERVSSSRRGARVAILDRAAARGELRADVDKELAMDFIPAPLY